MTDDDLRTLLLQTNGIVDVGIWLGVLDRLSAAERVIESARGMYEQQSDIWPTFADALTTYDSLVGASTGGALPPLEDDPTIVDRI